MRNKELERFKNFINTNGIKIAQNQMKAIGIAYKNKDTDLISKKVTNVFYLTFANFMNDFIEDTFKLASNTSIVDYEDLKMKTKIFEGLGKIDKFKDILFRKLGILPFMAFKEIEIEGSKISEGSVQYQLSQYAYYLELMLERAIENPKFNTPEMKKRLEKGIAIIDSNIKDINKKLVHINYLVSDVKNYDKYKDLSNIKKSLINIKRIISKIIWKVFNKEKFENKTWEKIKPVHQIFNELDIIKAQPQPQIKSKEI